MAYEAGTSTNINDLLDKFRLFAIAQGWTANRWLTVGSGRELCISKGTAYFNFRSFFNETIILNGNTTNNKYGIMLNGSDGYGGGDAWDRQPGYPVRNSGGAVNQCQVWMPTVLSNGPFPAYHFFAPDSKTLYCELEEVTGKFMRMGCGSLDLFNPAAPGGGRFCYALGGTGVTNSVTTTTWLGSDMDSGSFSQETVPFRGADIFDSSITRNGSQLRVASGSFDNWAGSGRSTDSTTLGMVCSGGGVHDKVLRDYSPNPLNNTGLLLPNIVSLNIGGQYLSPVGVVPGIRYMDMTNYLPGDEFSLGGDTWKVFPWYQKGGLGYNRGIAHLKVV